MLLTFCYIKEAVNIVNLLSYQKSLIEINLLGFLLLFNKNS